VPEPRAVELVTAKIIQKDPGWLGRLLKRYDSQEVLAVGYPASETGSIKYPDGTPVVLVAAVNQYGSQSMRIPARPFMTEGATAALAGDAGKVAETLLPLLNSGKITVAQILKEMGPFAEASFKGVFTGVAWTPNSDYTIEKKGSSQPLIDTALLRNTLTHVVRNR
jgi:hypothetical protein